MAANSGLDTRQAAIALDIYDLIKDIKDPERTETLEELDVVKEDDVKVECIGDDELWITISFTPTVPHCSLATLIGLCLRVKLERTLDQNFKLDVRLTEGTHTIEEDVNKQINDKERVAAAMENPDLRQIVEECVSFRTD